MPSVSQKIYRYVSIFSTILTTSINLLLIILTSRYIKRKFGMYKYLIIIFSTFGIIYDHSGFLISPMFHNLDAGFLYFTLVQSKFVPFEIIKTILASSASLFVSSTSMLAVMFIHRYFSVAKPEQLFYFQGKRLTLWLVYSSFFGVVCFFCFFNLCIVDDFTRQYVNNDLINAYGLVIDDLAVFPIIYFDTKYRWKPISFILFATLTMLFQNAIIIFCGIKIRRKLYSKTCNYSPSLHNLHRQLFKTLVLQVTIPTCFIFIPIFFIFYAPFLGIKLSLASSNVFCLFYLYPAIDSFIVMYVIKEYNNALRDFLKDIAKTFGSTQENQEVYRMNEIQKNGI